MRGIGVFLAIALSLLVLPVASQAGSPGATLYEVSERVKFDAVKGMIRRDAVSPLLGSADLGSPLCPDSLAVAFPGMTDCTVMGTGKDAVSLATGLGPVSGTFFVVINAKGNSSVHVPDLPVISGTFRGDIDLSLAVQGLAPTGFLNNGELRILKVDQKNIPALKPLVGESILFTGVFRLPVGDRELGITPADPANAYYITDLGAAVPVRQDQRAIGFPTVKLEVTFSE